MENVVTNSQVHEYSIMRRGFIIFLFFSFIISKVSAQDAAMSKKAMELFEKAQKAWQGRQLVEAVTLFEKVLETDPNSYETNLRLAQIYELQKKSRSHQKTLFPTYPVKTGRSSICNRISMAWPLSFRGRTL